MSSAAISRVVDMRNPSPSSKKAKGVESFIDKANRLSN